MAKQDNHYIRERALKSGKTALLIEIRAYGQSFRQSLKAEDYGGLSQCYKVAREIRNRKLVEMKEGRYIQHAPTVKELYEEKFSVIKVRASTKKSNDIMYRAGIAVFGDVPLDQITTADIQKTVNKYSATHTESMTRKFLTVWRQIFQCAAMKGLPVPDRTVGVVVDPNHCIRGKHRSKSISKSDFDAFCDALLQYHDYDAIGRYRSRCVWYALQLMAHCGLQPAEAYALTREDFHLDEPVPYISINKCVGTDFYDPEDVGRKYVPVSRNAKNVFRDRNIPLTEYCEELCRNLLEWTKYDPVFSDYDGKLFSSDAVCTYIRNVSLSCKITFTQYMLRHNFSTDMFAQNVNPAVIRDLMGHSSRSTAQTLDYAQSSESDRFQAMKDRKIS